jgi:hypothetical protein
MNRKPVSSSNILSIGYDPLTRTMEVEFGDDPDHSGRIYHYLDVPPETHRDLMSAESHGKFLHRNVMWVFSYQRVR